MATLHDFVYRFDKCMVHLLSMQDSAHNTTTAVTQFRMAVSHPSTQWMIAHCDSDDLSHSEVVDFFREKTNECMMECALLPGGAVGGRTP